MSLEQASAPAVAPAMPSQAVLGGRWLPVARYASLMVTAVVLVVFAASIPVYFEHLRTVCIEIACDAAPTPPPGAQALRAVGLSASVYAGYYSALDVVIALVYLTVAAVLFRRKPGERIALLGAFTLLIWGFFSVTFTISAATEVYPQWRFGFEYALFLGLVSITLFFFLFPDGRFLPGWSLWLALILILLLMPGYIWPNSPADYREWPPLMAAPLLLTWMGSMIGLQIYRYRRVSDAVQRQQTKWVVFGVGASFLGFFTSVTLPYLVSPSFHEESSLPGNLISNTGGGICMLAIPVSIGIAILRHRLWDIDIVISRTLVYGALTGIVVGLYVLIVGGLSALLRVEGNLLLSLLATGVIAVAFAPLRDRLQREVNRLIYGERHEPYKVLSGLGERLEAALAPDAVLPTIVQTVRDTPTLPYVAIRLKRECGFTIDASSGQPVLAPLRLPLLYQGEQIGELVLGLRGGTDSFSPADRKLLDDLARQASVAVHAIRLTGDLQRSRERLITAREEERRRLRHDLHDGLGPTLASMSLQLAAVRNRVAHDPTAVEILTDLKGQIQDAVTDVRRVVYALRPPALDELGLSQAIREHAVRLSHDGLQVVVETPESLPPLSAAVEIAAYRIVLEALTNVTRHARARNCLVRLSLVNEIYRPSNNTLQLEIIDNGCGMESEGRAGTGLVSMRERATELGGGLTIEPEPGGRTRVRARIPLEGPNA